jgi:hypothetical protein
MPATTAPRVGSRFAVPLRARIEVARPALVAATRSFWSGPDPLASYREYLCTMHAVLRATAGLLDAAADQCRALAADPLAGPLGDYLTTHAAEERGHETWLLEDMAVAGFDPADALARVPSPRVARMAGAQYYWVFHYHPVCVLGYVAVLEGDPPRPALAPALAARTGLPAGAFRTIRRHALLDPGHRDQLDALLARLPLTAEQEAAVTLSALHTLAAATAVFTELAAAPPPVPPSAYAKERTDG